jgi:ribosomal protein L29
MYKSSELRQKSKQELLSLISELKGKLLALRFESATGQLTETHLPSKTKKEIALIFTILKEKEKEENKNNLENKNLLKNNKDKNIKKQVIELAPIDIKPIKKIETKNVATKNKKLKVLNAKTLASYDFSDFDKYNKTSSNDKVEIEIIHDEKNIAKEGDKVLIMSTKPFSKTKTFRLVEIKEKRNK